MTVISIQICTTPTVHPYCANITIAGSTIPPHTQSYLMLETSSYYYYQSRGASGQTKQGIDPIQLYIPTHITLHYIPAFIYSFPFI